MKQIIHNLELTKYDRYWKSRDRCRLWIFLKELIAVPQQISYYLDMIDGYIKLLSLAEMVME